MLDINPNKIVSKDGFIEAYESLIPFSASYREAYERVEEVYEKNFSIRKYSGYACFKVILHKRHKKKKHSVNS